MSDSLDCVIVGAGVIGLAIGRALALTGREVVILEAESGIGFHTSSRNSEVIHAGIYYPENSLKARLCVRGKEALYRFCEEFDIPHRRIGKLIVSANADDLVRLRSIKAQAEKNDVNDLRFLDKREVAALEPNVVCNGALLSPSTGIIDSHEFMVALQAQIEAHNGLVVFNSEVTSIGMEDDGFRIRVDGENAICRTLINAAGLGAPALASRIENFPANRVPARWFAKGHYFSYQGRSPFSHLIYPLPADGGLGIHATNDMSGAARFGPDVTWIDDLDYSFDGGLQQKFISAIRQYFPTLDEGRLAPGYTGIRPKLAGPGQPAADFMIQGENEHGVRNLVNLFGIESPGLTASLAIAEHVADMLQAVTTA